MWVSPFSREHGLSGTLSGGVSGSQLMHCLVASLFEGKVVFQ